MWTPTYGGEVWDRMSFVVLFIMVAAYLNTFRILTKY